VGVCVCVRAEDVGGGSCTGEVAAGWAGIETVGWAGTRAGAGARTGAGARAGAGPGAS